MRHQSGETGLCDGEEIGLEEWRKQVRLHRMLTCGTSKGARHRARMDQVDKRTKVGKKYATQKEAQIQDCVAVGGAGHASLQFACMLHLSGTSVARLGSDPKTGRALRGSKTSQGGDPRTPETNSQGTGPQNPGQNSQGEDPRTSDFRDGQRWSADCGCWVHLTRYMRIARAPRSGIV